MRTHRLVGVCAVGLFFLSVQNLTRAASDELQVEYNARLGVTSRADLDQRLRAHFAVGTAHPTGILNCEELLSKQGRQAASRGSQTMHSTLVDCLVFSELRGALPAHSSFLRELKWDEQVLRLLPPQLAISVSAESKRAAETAANQGRNWQDVDPSVAASAGSKGPEEIVVTGNGFSERLILWGRGDFDGDGIEDLLVQSFDTLTEGTYRNTRLFVLTRRSAGGHFSLVRSLF